MRRRASYGFTLVELMVAITGGLFLSIIVFVLARDGSRFYQREMRVANATLATIVGFERLRADVTRAGFLTSPNVRRDPSVCGAPATDAGWPAELARMASVRLTPGGSPANATLNANERTPGDFVLPDSIVLAGSFVSADQFPIRTVIQSGNQYQVFLQTNSGAMARLGYFGTNAAGQLALLGSVFGAGRALRVVDKSGMQQFGTITGVTAGAQPIVTLSQTPNLRFRSAGASTLCGLKGYETGALANVVNFVRYDVRDLRANATYDPIYAVTGLATDANRTELARVELDTAGAPIPGTDELVAEYAVDLAFGLTVANTFNNGTVAALATVPAGSDQIAFWAGDTAAGGIPPNQGPQLVKSVRVRLSVRSREGDREGNIVPGGSVAPGFYRIGLGEGATAPFARVRTVQADIALRNQMGATWM